MRRKFHFLIVICIFILFITLSAIQIYGSINTKEPNILFITIDALRPDHLGCYSYKRNTSPNIDRLAKEGIIFTQAISQAAHTPPSLASILTSTYPVFHKVDNFSVSFPPDLITLSDILKSQGYITAFMSNYYILERISGFDKKFDKFLILDTYKFSSDSKPIKFREITNNIIEFISKNKEKNFFLWVHFMDTHQPPLNPPSPYDKIFLNDSYIQPEINVPVSNSNILARGDGGLPRALVKNNNNITNLNYYINLYDGAIRYVDSQIGLLLERLKRLRLDKKTLIIISADHGEGIGEHNIYFFHGPLPEKAISPHPEPNLGLKDKIGFHGLYDEDLKIPLIISYPEFIPKNKRIAVQIQSIDIAPTILDILDIQKPDQMAGRSLLSLIKSKNVGESTGRFAFSGIRGNYAIRTSDYKLIYSKMNNSYELYNLKKDPQEKNNLATSEEEIFTYEKLKEELDKYINQISPIERKIVPLDEEMKERLRSLGYVQ